MLISISNVTYTVLCQETSNPNLMWCCSEHWPPPTLASHWLQCSNWASLLFIYWADYLEDPGSAGRKTEKKKKKRSCSEGEESFDVYYYTSHGEIQSLSEPHKHTHTHTHTHILLFMTGILNKTVYEFICENSQVTGERSQNRTD